MLSDKFLDWLSECLAEFVGQIDEYDKDLEFLASYGSADNMTFDDAENNDIPRSVLALYTFNVDYESMRLWNIIYTLSAERQRRIAVRAVTEVRGDDLAFAMRVGGGRYEGEVNEVEFKDRKISPLYTLYLLRNSVISLVMIDNILYYEYYPYLYEVFSIAKNVKTILMSATMYTYFLNLSNYVNGVAKRFGVKYKLKTYLSVDDIYFPEMIKRMKIYRSLRLRYVRVHPFIQFMPRYLLQVYYIRFNRFNEVVSAIS